MDLVVQWIVRTQSYSLVSFISPAVVLFSLLTLNFHDQSMHWHRPVLLYWRISFCIILLQLG